MSSSVVGFCEGRPLLSVATCCCHLISYFLVGMVGGGGSATLGESGVIPRSRSTKYLRTSLRRRIYWRGGASPLILDGPMMALMDAPDVWRNPTCSPYDERLEFVSGIDFVLDNAISSYHFVQECDIEFLSKRWKRLAELLESK